MYGLYPYVITKCFDRYVADSSLPNFSFNSYFVLPSAQLSSVSQPFISLRVHTTNSYTSE
jgi:hypothetical protein